MNHDSSTRAITFDAHIQLPRRDALRAINELHDRPDGVPFDEIPADEHVEATQRVISTHVVTMTATVGADGSVHFAVENQRWHS